MDFKDIQKANESIKTMTITRWDKKQGKEVGKEYAEVNQRIKAFRMVYPDGFIVTDIVSMKDGIVLMKAEAGIFLPDGTKVVLGTGMAMEDKESSLINKTSFIENCETSAVGRALGMCGFGIDMSVASYEEVSNAMKKQEQMQAPEEYICANCGNTFEGGMHCPMCGVKVGKEKKKCPRCGEEYFSPACPSCGYKPSSGVAFFDSGFSTSFAGGGAVRTGPATVGRFNKWVAFFLCLFFGLWGIHKFYEGKIVLGIVYLFTFGIFGIGALIDLIFFGQRLVSGTLPVLPAEGLAECGLVRYVGWMQVCHGITSLMR